MILILVKHRRFPSAEYNFYQGFLQINLWELEKMCKVFGQQPPTLITEVEI